MHVLIPVSLSLSLSPQMHFIYLSRSTKRILAGLGSVFALMFVLVCCGLFFPYSADPSSPRPKRVFVQVPPSPVDVCISMCLCSSECSVCCVCSSTAHVCFTLRTARSSAPTPVCGSTVWITAACSTSHLSSRRSTTASARAAPSSCPTAASHGSCRSSPWSSE